MDQLNKHHHDELRAERNRRVTETNRLKMWIIALCGVVILSLVITASEMVKHHDTRQSSKTVNVARLLAEKASLQIELEKVKVELDDERRMRYNAAMEINELRAAFPGGLPVKF